MKPCSLTALAGSLLCRGLSLPAHAQLADKKALTLEAAKKIAAAAEAEAKKNKLERGDRRSSTTAGT